MSESIAQREGVLFTIFQSQSRVAGPYVHTGCRDGAEDEGGARAGPETAPHSQLGRWIRNWGAPAALPRGSPLLAPAALVALQARLLDVSDV